MTTWDIVGILSLFALGSYWSLLGFGFLRIDERAATSLNTSPERLAKILKICGIGLLIGSIYHVIGLFL